MRKLSEGNVYHVVTRGTGRQLIFENDSDRTLFLRLLAKGLNEHEAELYAWCLMGNHVHLLIHAPLQTVSALMKQVLGTYALIFNKNTGRVGHLFQSRFSSEPITDDEYLLTVIRYIHNNPVKAGLSSADAYRWSSYREYIAGARICQTEFPLTVFGGINEFKRFHQQDDSKDTCLDMDELDNEAKPASNERAIEVLRQTLEDIDPQNVKALPTSERNDCLRALKSAGLSVRQIERLTGIGRNTVSRA